MTIKYYFAAFGWIQNTLEGQEQSSSYIVQGGYSKGSGSTVDVFVDLVQDPEAVFHASKFIGLRCVNTENSLVHFGTGIGDFGGNSYSSATSISLRTMSLGSTDIPITLAVDNVGQEGTERGILRMRIAEDSEQPVGTFFKRDLTVIITDTSSECTIDRVVCFWTKVCFHNQKHCGHAGLLCCT